MLSVEEALQQVLARARLVESVVCSAREALGLVLAEEIASDVDSPPHDKSIVDGYAVVAADLASGLAELEILEEVTAGALPTRAVGRGQTTRIMTGAAMPAGAEAVVMIEQSQLIAPDQRPPRVRLTTTRIDAGQNIMRRAASMTRGEVVLQAGSLLRSVELGILAEVGREQVRVVRRPTMAVLPTGNELVPPGQTPAPGQIRNSNGPMLLAAAQGAGAMPVDLGIAGDDASQLSTLIAQGLENDVLVISGGVSAGVLDLVPGVLEKLGVRQVFHKVHLKPGKPLWFGVLERGASPTLVFGLPGNPVSSLVCFELFVRPAIGRLAGHGDTSLAEVAAELTVDYFQRGDRPTYYPARLEKVEGQWRVEPLRWQGSGDLRTLVQANALAYFPAGERAYASGETVCALRLPCPK